MDQTNSIKKMISNINNGDYASAKETLKVIIEKKIQERIKDAITDK